MPAAVAAGNHEVRLSALLNANPTIHTGKNKPFTGFTDVSAVFSRDAHPGSHRDPSSHGDVGLGEFFIFMDHVFRQLEEPADPLAGNFLR
jgi:hypothetical protein